MAHENRVCFKRLPCVQGWLEAQHCTVDALKTKAENFNRCDGYVVAVVLDDSTVAHIPCKISKIFFS